MRTDPVKDGDDTGPLMTLEEMSWATDTISGEEMKRMLSGGLDLDHFMVMLVRVIFGHQSPFARQPTWNLKS